MTVCSWCGNPSPHGAVCGCHGAMMYRYFLFSKTPYRHKETPMPEFAADIPGFRPGLIRDFADILNRVVFDQIRDLLEWKSAIRTRRFLLKHGGL